MRYRVCDTPLSPRIDTSLREPFSTAVDMKLTRSKSGLVPNFRQHLLRCTYGTSQVQCEHRICLYTKLQDPPKYVLPRSTHTWDSAQPLN
jgi:hypothetical protein